LSPILQAPYSDFEEILLGNNYTDPGENQSGEKTSIKSTPAKGGESDIKGMNPEIWKSAFQISIDRIEFWTSRDSDHYGQEDLGAVINSLASSPLLAPRHALYC